MILEAEIHGECVYAETWPEIAALIEEVMNNLTVEDPTSQWIVPGETARFRFVWERRPRTHLPPWPDNYLTIAVNAKTGYGGLTWFTVREGVDAEIADYVWLSDNPEPPGFDPRVVSDPCFPIFYNPESTLPVAQVRAALVEFCQARTGNRPNCIGWTKGDLAGRRDDVEPNIGIKRLAPVEPAVNGAGHSGGTQGHRTSAEDDVKRDPWSWPSG